MKLEISAIALLVLLFAASLWNTSYLERKMDDLISQIDEAEAVSNEGDFDDASAKIETALEHWLELDAYLQIFIREEEVDITTDVFYDLLGVVYDEDDTSTPAIFRKLREHLSSIARVEHLTLRNIL